MSSISKLEMIIERVVRRVVREELAKGTIAESREVSEPKVQPKLHKKRPPTNTTTKQYTKNAMLNDILNETVQSAEVDEWPTMTFDSSRVAMDGAFGMSARVPDMPVTIPAVDLDGKRVDMNKPEMESVVGALTRDYSALMKAINKKKGS